MKIFLAILITLAPFAAPSGYSQNLFVYDQQSTNLIEGGVHLLAQFQPAGQSFQPTFNSVGFVELQLYDSDISSNSGAFMFVNLRSNSITGPILGTTASVFLSNNFFGVTNFLFPTPIAVTPGVTYFLQPEIQSGDSVTAYVTDSYPNGTAIILGIPDSNNRDLWFREGIVVPEPSSACLALVGAGLLFGWWWVRSRRRGATVRA